MPQKVSGTSKRLLYLKENNFKITSNIKTYCDIIEENKVIYKKMLFNSINISNFPKENLLTELNIEIESSNICPGYPNSDINESCKKL